MRMFSMDNPKAAKAVKYGWLNAIHYMAPARVAGVGNLCPHASDGCKALCLGEHSGNAALYPSVMRSRIAKARLFMSDRQSYMSELVKQIEAAQRHARRANLSLCVRLNGSTDIAWEGLRCGDHQNLMAAFPDIQFVDYTKSVKRALAFARGNWPLNYHLTFSRSESNEADCLRVLEAGVNVAAVFANAFPRTYLNRPTFSGDEHDLRHLDMDRRCSPTGKGFVVALTPKGRKAKADTSGFVIR